MVFFTKPINFINFIFMTQEMTPAQYAKKRRPKITTEAVHKAIRLKHRLPGVVEVKKFSRFYILIVNPLEVILKKPVK